MEGNSEVALRKAQRLNPARTQKLNKFIVEDHFSSIPTAHDLLDLPERIFNMDKKGCRLYLHKYLRVLAQKGIARVHIVEKEHQESVTIIACENAVGSMTPPMVLFSRVQKVNQKNDSKRQPSVEYIWIIISVRRMRKTTSFSIAAYGQKLTWKVALEPLTKLPPPESNNQQNSGLPDNRQAKNSINPPPIDPPTKKSSTLSTFDELLATPKRRKKTVTERWILMERKRIGYYERNSKASPEKELIKMRFEIL
ncbi:hypothetical protein ILUMI_02564 [Ignelater luminosus]|uniref:Uncharacterized protein n=1 Tax=Ignelater luminosus TaxID=2038154 RepID=A0A8K0DI31_IGNLU|nr:hypothetical protein ILUMI_02564 [Ignelater luminosus]